MESENKYQNTGTRQLPIDNDYLNAVYFPETSPAARIPTWFNAPSTTFSQRFHFYQNTGPNGNGLIMFAPQDVTSRPCLRVPSSADYTNTDGRSLGQTTPTIIGSLEFVGQGSRYISENYAQVRLVGASMRVSYIGSTELEAGFMSGSHVYNTTPFEMNDEAIEEGYFAVQNVKPSQGVRLVYYPKDESDLEFHSPTVQFMDNDNNNSEMASTAIIPDDFYLAQDDNSAVQPSSQNRINIGVLGTSSSTANQLSERIEVLERSKSASYYWGLMDKQLKSQNPQILAAYWRGLQPNQNWVRIDIERHFEGIPKQSIKDLVCTMQADECEEAIKFVTKQGRNGLMHGHTVSHYQNLQEIVKPNIGVLPSLGKLLTAEQSLGKTGMATVLQKLTQVVKNKFGTEISYDLSNLMKDGYKLFKDIKAMNDDTHTGAYANQSRAKDGQSGNQVAVYKAEN